MIGPYSLTADRIDAVVTKKQAGDYVLGPFNGDGKKVIVYYAGRSDADLPGRLKQWVGKYKAFAYYYASSPMDAFKVECELYHDFNPRDNSVHPARPSGSNWKCPRCKIFD